MTAVMIIFFWLLGATPPTTVYFATFEACEAALPAVEAQAKAFSSSAAVSAACYEEARN